MKPASDSPRPRSKSAPDSAAVRKVARLSLPRPRFGPEPTPQPATGARLRHLEARRNIRSSARLRRAKPGPATQPTLVLRRIPRRSAAVVAEVLSADLAEKGNQVASVAPQRPRATRRSTVVTANASAAGTEPVAPAAAPTASVPPVPQAAPGPAGDSTKAAVRSVPPLPPFSELIGSKASRPRRPVPPMPAILLEGDLPAPRTLSPSAQIPSVATSLAAPVPAEVPSASNAPVHREGRSADVALPAVPMWSTPPSPAVSPKAGVEGDPIVQPDRNPQPFPSLARRPEGSVWLTPRDPRTFLACWTFPGSVLDSFRAHAGSGNWSWRLRGVSSDGPVIASGPLPANEGFVFIGVALPGVRHVLELGLDHGGGGWTSLAFSAPECTPGIPSHGPAATPRSVAFPPPTGGGFVQAHVAVPTGVPEPGERGGQVPGWSVPEDVLEEVLHGLRVPAPAAGSSELGPDIPESTTRRVRVGVPACGASTVPPEATVPVGIHAESSDAVPTPPPSAPEGFWMRVNAEVVLHGSTEPDAQVSIAGRPVRLRPDGSFTFRFALPDGDFTLPVVAVSGSGVDARAAEVRFVRQTRLSGAVGVHPIDPNLKPPRVESLS